MPGECCFESRFPSRYNPLVAIAIVLAFDAAMFLQAQLCIESIRRYCPFPHRICVVGVDLLADHLSWLHAMGAIVFTDWRQIRIPSDAPRHAAAQFCRPHLPGIFERADVYIYVDADVRFLSPAAFQFYVSEAMLNSSSIVIAQELDPAYQFCYSPTDANAYHAAKYERIASTYDAEAAEYVRYFYSFNSGLFAMSCKSKLWQLYQIHADIALTHPYHHMAEQDALNMAIIEDKCRGRTAPTTMNWLCSAAIPACQAQSRRLVRPAFPYEDLHVLHLTGSNAALPGGAPGETLYDFYRHANLTQ